MNGPPLSGAESGGVQAQTKAALTRPFAWSGGERKARQTKPSQGGGGSALVTAGLAGARAPTGAPRPPAPQRQGGNKMAGATCRWPSLSHRGHRETTQAPATLGTHPVRPQGQAECWGQRTASLTTLGWARPPPCVPWGWGGLGEAGGRLWGCSLWGQGDRSTEAGTGSPLVLTALSQTQVARQ